MCTECQEQFRDVSDFGIYRHRCGMNISFTHNNTNPSNNIPLNSSTIVNDFRTNTQQVINTNQMNSFNTPESVIAFDPFLEHDPFGKLMKNQNTRGNAINCQVSG